MNRIRNITIVYIHIFFLSFFKLSDRIETEGDRLHRRITSMLFSGNYDAMTILRINPVIDAFEESLDEMARVARIIRTIALKES